MLYIMWLYMLLVGYCIISALLQSVTDYHGVSGGYRSIMEVGHTGELQSVISDSACIATDSMKAGYLLPPIIGFPLNVNRHKVLSFRPSNKHIGTHIYELSDVKSTANSIYSASKIAIKEPVCSLHSLKNIHICHKQNMISNLRLCVLFITNFQGWWLIGINKKRKKNTVDIWISWIICGKRLSSECYLVTSDTYVMQYGLFWEVHWCVWGAFSCWMSVCAWLHHACPWWNRVEGT